MVGKLFRRSLRGSYILFVLSVALFPGALFNNWSTGNTRRPDFHLSQVFPPKLKKGKENVDDFANAWTTERVRKYLWNLTGASRILRKSWILSEYLKELMGCNNDTKKNQTATRAYFQLSLIHRMRIKRKQSGATSACDSQGLRHSNKIRVQKNQKRQRDFPRKCGNS